MNRLQYLLSKLAEECGELAQAACKAQQFGLESINPNTQISSKQELIAELTDVDAVFSMIAKEYGLYTGNMSSYMKGIEAKIDKVNKYYEISKQEGFVQ